ncbi:MAG: hypothetical protein IT232_03255 [Flavobacteriales bacterium]|nr:hypothetical protein [Flavobacteriales bacterium]
METPKDEIAGTMKGRIDYVINFKKDGTAMIQYQNSPENLLIGLSMTIDSVEHVIAKNNMKKRQGIKQTISPERNCTLKSTSLWLREQQRELLGIAFQSVTDFLQKETEKKLDIKTVQAIPDDMKKPE